MSSSRPPVTSLAQIEDRLHGAQERLSAAGGGDALLPLEIACLRERAAILVDPDADLEEDRVLQAPADS